MKAGLLFAILVVIAIKTLAIGKAETSSVDKHEILQEKLSKELKGLGERLIQNKAPWALLLSSNQAPPKNFSEKLKLYDPNSLRKSKFKIVRISTKGEEISTEVLVNFSGTKPNSSVFELNAKWDILWKKSATGFVISAIKEFNTQEATRERKLLLDKTGYLFCNLKSAWKQLRTPGPEWLKRITSETCYTTNFYQGLSVVDVNNDGLDDVYICQNDGLPNRLFIQNPDGTLSDISATSGLNFLDRTRSAVFVDLDNDGDKDVLLGTRKALLVMENIGGEKIPKFTKKTTLMNEFPSIFTIAVADYDNDGFLDFYVCNYEPNEAGHRFSLRPQPESFHDARNGGVNKLFKNLGKLAFKDVTSDSGLNKNNSNFSLSATWHDFDEDGDPDLYVANDFGKNNFFINEGGKFEDKIETLGLQDQNFSMNAVWGDYNRDGISDLYVSNMFSSAGNRVTYQPNFAAKHPDLKKNIQQMAKGNSLFTALPSKLGEQKQFKENASQQGVHLGRWAWGSHFLDIDNNGWQDLIVTNGFLTNRKEDDL